MIKRFHPRAPLAGAIALNALLLAVLAFKMLPQRAEAQGPAPAAASTRARGEYTMTTGKPNVGGPDVIAVLDAANQEMLFLRWDQSRQQLQTLGYRSLSADANLGQGR